MYAIFFPELPALPKDLEEVVWRRVSLGNDEFDKIFNATNYEYYSLDHELELVGWIKNNVLSKILENKERVAKLSIGVHVIKAKIAIHVDHKRDACVNYILTTGGENVMTKYYQKDQKSLLAEYCIAKNEWHALLTNVDHGIHGVAENTNRIALTIGIKEDDFKNITKKQC